MSKSQSKAPGPCIFTELRAMFYELEALAKRAAAAIAADTVIAMDGRKHPHENYLPVQTAGRIIFEATALRSMIHETMAAFGQPIISPAES